MDRESREKYLDAWLALTGQTPAPDSLLELPLLSGSMLPAIPAGSLLQIEISSGDRCRIGDLIIFIREDVLVAHRLLLNFPFPGRELIFEKGDNNDFGEWIRRNRVCGRVHGVILPDTHDPVPASDPVAASTSLRRQFLNVARRLLGRYREPDPTWENPDE